MAAEAGTPSKMPRYFRLPLHTAPWEPGDRQGWLVTSLPPTGTRETFWGEGEHTVERTSHGEWGGHEVSAITQRLGLEAPPSPAGPLAVLWHLPNTHPVGCARLEVLEGVG